MKAKAKVPVTTRAVIQRINRRLKADGEVLKSARGTSAPVLGDYYSIDLGMNCVRRKFVDLEKLARQLGVLAEFEVVLDAS